jgi:Mg-chelatase subunit ChlD
MFANFVRRGRALALIGVTATPLLSQTIITGTVRVERGGPLSGAVVQVTGTHGGVPTNDNGRYRLELPRGLPDRSDSVTLVARRIGYQPMTRRIAVHGESVTLDFELKASMLQLEGVVVTGTAGATDEGAPGIARKRAGEVVAPRPALDMVDSRAAREPAAADRLSKTRGDGVRSGRGSGREVRQEPAPGVLTAAVWDDSQHWPQYARFLERASKNSWNPWGLEVGQSNVRPVRAEGRRRSQRRAVDIGFLVDATGSMGDEMTFLQSEIKDIVRRVRGTEPDLDIRLSVVFYRDRGDDFITKSLPFTRSADEAVSFISGTTANGGGDFPEDMNAGLEAMMRQSWSRDAVPQMLFVLADAPPHQYPGEDYTYHEAIADAAASGIAIFPVAASGVDKPTEFLLRAMAVMTGGKYVFLTDDSGVGDSHEEPDITGYKVEKLNDLMVREIRTFVADRVSGRSVAEIR